MLQAKSTALLKSRLLCKEPISPLKPKVQPDLLALITAWNSPYASIFDENMHIL